MSPTETSVRKAARARSITLSVVFALLLLLALRLLLTPDPAGALLFARAQRLEAAGLAQPAQRQYRLLAQTHPDSPHAPHALMREAALWLQFGRAGESGAFATAVEIYRAIAARYPQTSLSGRALLASGAISLVDLGDEKAARIDYERALKDFGGNSTIAPEATLRLGRVAQIARDGKTAQRWFQAVASQFPGDAARCAEAQYALGETYETLLRNRDWARNAYETTLRLYPKTVWAGKAKERLGLMLYHEAAPRARRVLLQIPAVPLEDDTENLLQGVRLVLAARGVDAGGATLRGWSLAPFYAGYFPSNPGRVARFTSSAWRTVAANAGLRFRISDGGDAKSALQTLQTELDAAHLALVWTKDEDGARWRLASGYDSARDSVWLQRGAEMTNPSTREFSLAWNRSSELGGPFGMVSFEAPGEELQANLKPAPISSVPPPGKVDGKVAAPLANPAKERAPKLNYAQVVAQRSPLAAPTFLYSLKPLDERAAHRRTLKRAAEWLRRGRDENNGALLGAGALRSIATELRRFAEGETVSAAPEPTLPDEPLAREEDVANEQAAASPEAASTATPTASPNVASNAAPRDLNKLRALLRWKDAPLSAWLDARRDAVSYLEIAASRLGSDIPRQAARDLAESIAALEDARALMPSPDALGRELSPRTRSALQNAAAKLDAAREAETRAANALDSLG